VTWVPSVFWAAPELSLVFECLNVFPYRHLIAHKAYADFKSDAQRTYIGVAWWVLDPLLNMLVYYLVFQVILKRGTDDFLSFLIIGLVVWRWFSANVSQGSKSIFRNVEFVRQVSIKKLVFPLSVAMTNFYQFIFSLMLLFAVLFTMGHWPHIHYLALPILLLVMVLLGLAVTLPLSAVTPFFPDLGLIIDHMLGIMFFLSAILYPVDTLPDWVQRIAYYNPMIVLIDAFRDVLLYKQWPDWKGLAIVSAVSLGGIYLGAFLIAKFDDIYAKRVVD